MRALEEHYCWYHAHQRVAEYVNISADVNNGGKLVFDKSTKRINNIQEWKQAFDVFIAIYTQKDCNKNAIGDLLTYAHDIENLANDHYDCTLYDQHYRIDRASASTPLSWSTLNQHLYNAVIRRGKIGSFRTTNADTTTKLTTSEDNGQIPKGYYFAYHTPSRRCQRNPYGYKHA